jgi:Dna[CI] antecedent, DciA
MVSGWRPVATSGDDPLALVALAWGGIVGARVAQHSRPLEINGDALLVATRSSAWSQQLQLLSPQILERMRALNGVPPVTRLRFRSGLLRAGTSPPVPALRAGRAAAATEPAPVAAADEHAAFERLRARIAGVVRTASGHCPRCGAPTERPQACAPCRGESERTRRLELERVLYNLPWLDASAVRELVPEVDRSEFEAARRSLLQRWWGVLERARRAGKPLLPRERQVASSYVLLQSGLEPDRITAAVVRNLLGDELEAQLYRAQDRPPRS